MTDAQQEEDTKMALRNAKNALRKEIKRRLKDLSEPEKIRQSAVVTKMLLETPEYQESTRISIFLSMADELKTDEILKDVLRSNRKCYIPRYIGPTMEMVRLHSLDDYNQLPETSWKIKQPADDEVREDALQTGGLELILMPGLGFTNEGDRLGRGKGYYDTYLSSVRYFYQVMGETVEEPSSSVTSDTADTDTLQMYEEMFKHRYTDEDEEFVKTRDNPLSDPPCVENWYQRPKRNFDRGGGRGGRGGWGGGGRGGGGGGYNRDRRDWHGGRDNRGGREGGGWGNHYNRDRHGGWSSGGGGDRGGRTHHSGRGGGGDRHHGNHGGNRYQPYERDHRQGRGGNQWR